MDHILFPITMLLILLTGRHTSTTQQTAVMLHDLFGNCNELHSHAIWEPKEIPKAYEHYFYNGRGRTSLESDTYFNESGEPKRFVVFSTIPDEELEYDCHACSVLLSAAVLHSSDGKKWFVESQSDFLTEGGAWGDAPDISLQWLGKEHVALRIEDSDMHQGFESGTIGLFAEASTGLKRVLSLRSENDNTDLDICLRPQPGDDTSNCHSKEGPYCLSRGANREKNFRELCTSWTGSLSVLSPTAGTGWSDVVFTQRVLAAAPGAFTRKLYRIHLVYKNGSYVPVGPPSHGPRVDLDWYKNE